MKKRFKFILLSLLFIFILLLGSCGGYEKSDITFATYYRARRVTLLLDSEDMLRLWRQKYNSTDYTSIKIEGQEYFIEVRKIEEVNGYMLTIPVYDDKEEVVKYVTMILHDIPMVIIPVLDDKGAAA